MSGILSVLANKRMSEMELVDALLFVGIILFFVAGGFTWTAARSHANRDKPAYYLLLDHGLPPFRWPWVLSYVFLAVAGLLFLLAMLLWR